MLQTSEPPDHCPSCPRESHVSYTHNHVTVGPCVTHWRMHCSGRVPYDLKEVCSRYESEDDVGT